MEEKSIQDNEQIEKKISNFLSTNTITVAIITIISVAGVYFYELGYCASLKIPKEYISIELSRYSFLIFLIITVLFFTTFFSMPFIMLISKIRNKQKTSFFERIIEFSPIATIYFLMYITRDGDILVMMSILGTLIIAATLFMFSKKYTPEKGRYIDYSTPYFQGSLILFSLSIVCILSFLLGELEASKVDKIYLRNDNKTVFLRKYGNISVFGLKSVDKRGETVITFHHIEENGAKNDTLNYYIEPIIAK